MRIAAHAREETVGRFNQNIVAIWSELTELTNYTYVGTSTDGGLRYAVRKLTPVDEGARERQVAVSTTTHNWYIYANQEYPDHMGVLFTSADAGVSWRKQVLSHNASPGWILVNGSTIYISWPQMFADGVHFELIYSLDDGDTWSAPDDLSGPTEIKKVRNEDEVYRPMMSIRGKEFDVVYESHGDVVVASTADITAGMSKSIALGPGTNGVIAGGNVLWLGPGVGQHQAIFYAHCQ
jgi:hypothetical protein